MYELSRPARPSRLLRRVSSIFCCGGVCCQFFGLLAKPLSCTRLSGAVAIHRRSAVQILAYEAAASPQVRRTPRNCGARAAINLASYKTLAISKAEVSTGNSRRQPRLISRGHVHLIPAGPRKTAAQPLPPSRSTCRARARAQRARRRRADARTPPPRRSRQKKNGRPQRRPDARSIKICGLPPRRK